MRRTRRSHEALQGALATENHIVRCTVNAGHYAIDQTLQLLRNLMHFKADTNDVWALVPGPAKLSGSVPTDSVREIADYVANDIESHALRFDGVSVAHDATPDHEYWKAQIQNRAGTLLLRMTLHDQATFGGFTVCGDCDRQLVVDFWLHLQTKFPAIWLFAPDLRIYSPQAAIDGPLAQP